MKRVILFLLMLISMTLISGCDVGDFEIDGDYVYQWVKGEYAIQNLSEEGKKKELLIIPTEYKGNKLVLGKRAGYYAGDSLLSGNAKKVFIPFIYNEWRYDYFKLNPAKVFVISTEKTDRIYSGTKYIPSLSFIDKEYGKPANISYYYNYENSPNRGYYWIDDYSYGEKITFIPENPAREGYIFEGWYKETECMNPWEYERDTLPEEVIDEEGKPLYQETKLYAKWIKEQH